MPCFTVGQNTAKILSAALKIPLCEFSHQEGHISAVLYSAKKTELFNRDFLAFHVSGGTTEAVLAKGLGSGFELELVAQTLDLNAGQALDRVGLMLGLKFPCGPQLEQLALKNTEKLSARPTIKGCDCCLSGVENQCKKLISQGKSPEYVSAYCLEDKITFRLSDGLEKLKVGEADTIIIAGMGGPLMEQILTKGRDVALSCKELILQPQSDIPHFRRYLMDEGYQFLDERCVFDEGKYYFPMRVCPPTSEFAPEGYKLSLDVEFEYGGNTLQQKNETLREFLLKEKNTWEKTLEQVEASGSEKVESRRREIQEKLSLIHKGLEYYESI
jgi:tRNA A22 N-methylase